MGCMLNPIQVYEFVRAIAWQLEDNGLGVIVPPGLTSGAGESRLGVSIKAQITQKKGERLGLQSLLKYKLELAVGDQSISQDDFELPFPPTDRGRGVFRTEVDGLGSGRSWLSPPGRSL